MARDAVFPDHDTVFPRSLRYLLAVADALSFTRAAELLCISQPALSQQIKQLEDSLDVQLIDRSGRAVRLTDSGQVYVRYARRALLELSSGKRAMRQLQDLSRGSLELGITPITGYLVTSLLESFSSRYPQLELRVREMFQSEIEVEVAEDRLDLGITFTDTLLSSEVRSTDIETHVLFIEMLQLAVGAEHPLAAQSSPVDGHALQTTPLVLLDRKFALRRHIDLYCLEHGIEPCVAMEATSMSVIVELVRLGRLATVLPRAIACAQSGLSPVMLVPELPHHAITLICRHGAYKSLASRAFTELASEWSTCRCEAVPADRLGPCPLAETCAKSVEGARERSRAALEEGSAPERSPSIALVAAAPPAQS
ncbi:MAG TPA: transcriptional regulator CynR [Burkholderiales bacterium]|nr:transcriptional regulator CynR [Burkholderiales bacterium]